MIRAMLPDIPTITLLGEFHNEICDQLHRYS